MKTPSNLPPGVTDRMIEEQCRDLDYLDGLRECALIAERTRDSAYQQQHYHESAAAERIRSAIQQILNDNEAGESS